MKEGEAGGYSVHVHRGPIVCQRPAAPGMCTGKVAHGT